MSGTTFLDVPASGTFTVIMRDDTAYSVRKLYDALARRHPLARETLVPALTQSYFDFREEVQEALPRMSRHADHTALHLVDSRQLADAVRRRTRSERLISLDPLFRRGAHPLRASRGFLLGGRESVGVVPGPGRRPLGEQVAALAATGHPYTLVDDDIVTGTTLSAVLRSLREAGVRVRRVVPGIRVAGPEDAALLGVPVEPVLQYRTTGTGGQRALEVADTRNFLLGVSGLVVRLPDGGWARAPYWLPFVRTSERSGISPACDQDFAICMLVANLRFFLRIGQLLDGPVLVVDLRPAVHRLLTSLGIADLHEPVTAVLERLMGWMDDWTDLLHRWETDRLPAATGSLV
ncbi:phosphoribosyltransferase [Streptomyces catenulae]|uniref:Phosphoribosyltransferase n=1 Tax=Streptomyces catenulae TaxID=66875 RepID=A0ABV2YZX8_9ACTN|nr:phosphoribosyltransferase [Streptomyces catenulae]